MTPNRQTDTSLQRRLVQLRWPIVIIVVGAAAIHQAMLFALLRVLPPAQHSLAQLAVYSITGVVVVWIGLRWLARAIRSQDRAEADLAQAYTELAASNRQLAMMAVDLTTQARQGMDKFLEQVLQTTITGWHAQAGAILLLETDTDAWQFEVSHGLAEGQSQLLLPLAGQTTPEQPVALEQLQDLGRLATAAVVRLQAEGEALGALFLGFDRQESFKPAQVDLLATTGSQIALAIRNAQLYDQLRGTAVLEERYRLSREMHDGLAQTLSVMGMQAERMQRQIDRGEIECLPEEIEELQQVMAAAYDEVREAIDNLRLSVDGPGGLNAALQAQAEDFSHRTGMVVDCERLNAPDDLSPEVALNLLRISQEALSNVRRHAEASQVRMALLQENGHLALTVADDGNGFDPAVPQDRHHVGLSSMRERVQSLDGRLTLDTSPGEGTRITARVPLK